MKPEPNAKHPTIVLQQGPDGVWRKPPENPWPRIVFGTDFAADSINLQARMFYANVIRDPHPGAFIADL